MMPSMYTVDRHCGKPKAPFGLLRVLLSLLFCVLFHGKIVAHPVAQGALEVLVYTDRVGIRAAVSSEEVLVASALAGKNANSFAVAAKGHGDYLLSHIHVAVNGRELQGREARLVEAGAARPVYQLDYRLQSGELPQRIEFREDVLREFEFAPGNQWEASYLVSIAQQGYPTVEGMLLSFSQPLKFERQTQCQEGSLLGMPPMVWAFARHGIVHILSGYDHLLFVAALVLAAAGLWDLIKVISAFTLAHTVTLTLSALDLFRLPSLIVEPMIAASIVIVAVQNIFWPSGSRGWSRLAAAFLFGLFHGLGFAGGLLDAMSGMTSVSAALAIASFSAGVEIGHQIVVLPTYCGLSLLRRSAIAGQFSQQMTVQRYGSALISVAGMVYLVAALW